MRSFPSRKSPRNWVTHADAHLDWNHWMDFKNAPPWKTILPPSAKLPYTVGKLRKVIDELDVEHAARYKADALRSWCNIFVTDVLTAMDLPPTHWVNEKGDPAREGKDNIELNANGMAKWFEEHGGRFGWISADRQSAVDAAARGHVVVVSYQNPTGHSGHVAILLPEGTIAQAGRLNFVGRTVREGFGNLPVKFWVNIHGPHSNE